jgi:geranylgeranyl diphosphate/geranylgeranyl-bacteriochlorophyllide a reductase
LLSSLSGVALQGSVARQFFMRAHKTVFRVLVSMQNAYYRSDERQEGFVSLHHDIDVQRLSFEAYMNKKLVKARPMTQHKIGLMPLAHVTRLTPMMWT